jgi:hypothetical protein
MAHEKTIEQILESIEAQHPIWVDDMKRLCEQLPNRFKHEQRDAVSCMSLTETCRFMYEVGNDSYYYTEIENPFQSTRKTDDHWSDETIMWRFPKDWDHTL